MYDLDELALSNYHIHTKLSPCAKSEMVVSDIIASAERAGLRTIALTDHHHGSWQDIISMNDQVRREVEACNPDIDVFIGAELSAYGIGQYADTFYENKHIDYHLYSCNHYHLDFWEHPADKTPRAYAVHYLTIVKELILTGRAECIAHPFSTRFLKGVLADPGAVAKETKDSELAEILELGKLNNVAWELNAGAIIREPGIAKRYFDIGREIGVVFRLGTDAHALGDINTKQFLPELKSILY